MHFDSSQAYMTKIGHVLGGDMTIVAMEFVQVLKMPMRQLSRRETLVQTLMSKPSRGSKDRTSKRGSKGRASVATSDGSKVEDPLPFIAPKASTGGGDMMRRSSQAPSMFGGSKGSKDMNRPMKHALIIGISAYHTSDEDRREPLTLAREVNAALKELEFVTHLHLQLSTPALFKALEDFISTLRKDDVVMFFFFGPGCEHDGKTWLFSKDSNPARTGHFESLDPSTLPRVALDANDAMVRIVACQANFNILHVDWARVWEQENAKRGLAAAELCSQLNEVAKADFEEKERERLEREEEDALMNMSPLSPLSPMGSKGSKMPRGSKGSKVVGF
jgi:hypothetical protein